MKLSLITPTHAPRYLPEAYDSLCQQDYADWEWVILLNGDKKNHEIGVTLAMQADPRVRVMAAETASTNIGALKYEACCRSTGDVLIEFDHDDLLVPGSLPKIQAAFEAGAGFVYSDSAVFEEDLASWGYHPSYGWEHYPVRVYNRPFVVTKTFPLSPRMLCEVYYAPDHVRCWSRKAYFKVGGHDQTLPVADDHDLICRTYLAGFPFHYTGDCCYLYRWHSNNTVKLRNQQIQKHQAENRRKYLMPLVAEWCRREKLATLDLNKLWKEKWWHPEKALSNISGYFRENTYGQIVASDVMQFVPPSKLARFMNDIYRMLLPGGYVHINVPSETGRYASMNPKHISRFNLNSFLYYSRREFAQNDPDIACRFDLIQNEEFYPDEKFKTYDMKMIRADLCALKGQKHPGPTLI